MRHRSKAHTHWKEEQRKIRRMVLHESLFGEYIKGNTYEGIYHVEGYSRKGKGNGRGHHTRHRIREIRERVQLL